MKIEEYLSNNPYTAALLRVFLPVLVAGICLIAAAYIHRPRYQRWVDTHLPYVLDTDTGMTHHTFLKESDN